MKFNGNALRIGNVLEHKKRLWIITKAQAVKPGKGGAFNQVEMKDIRNGTKINERFRAGEQVEVIRLEQREATYLYDDGNILYFMDPTTYSQIEIDAGMIGDKRSFLKNGLTVSIEFFEQEPLSISLPHTVVMRIVEADSVIKGQTSAASYKPALLENGLKILVPPYIETGACIIVKTEDFSYVERAKNDN
ncbi:translation elongation factor P [Candidatus Endolissoclinum faulkneri L5]|uniref:Elongation factor P n=1 Tax=Candidatus Endolissoclinum faulkneri L5 TaxID=1401328 RepID=V9TT54_9PROT|nr:elongation factor P [Candidatus Endolissoclinum faulkneri]AHC73756.1 translation elongation factor P [Candidatus Endolissoclinum faulkneri L5]